MDTPEHDYGRVLSVDAEAIGEPGSRRFRLLVRSSDRAAAVWMEKQQLSGIADWLAELLARLDKEKPSDEPDVEPLPFSQPFDLEMRASQIGLGYTESEDAFVIHAFDADQPRSAASQPSFRCSLRRGQARVLSRKIIEVVSAGRPICPLCQAPIESTGHACPRANGHHA